MGTNYYVKRPARNKCEHCHREDPPETIHIGKHSGGWKFCFNPRFKTYRQWQDFLALPENIIHIYDEYGKKIDYSDFFFQVVYPAQDGIWLFDPRATPEHTGPLTHVDKDQEWLDSDGFRFTKSTEFC